MQVCIANDYETHPMVFKDEAEMKSLLALPGVHDVTSNLVWVIKFGIVNNVLYLIHGINEQFLNCDPWKKATHAHTIFMSSFFIKISCLVQFTLMCYYRFSHAGQVCCGGYNYYLDDKDFYKDYYVNKKLANFIQTYCFYWIGLNAFILCCCGCWCNMSYTIQSMNGMGNINTALWNQDIEKFV